MPEGDTVHRTARVLREELPGRTIDRLELRQTGEVRELAGRTVESVEAIGKHVLIAIDGGWTLRVHLGMHGRWRALHARQARPAGPTALIVAGESAFVCEGAYRAELIRTAAVRSHPKLARLGPDLLADPPRIDEAVRRARLPAHAGREIAEVLLDQRIAAGIGNVYKSEVLFELRIHPRTHVRDIDDQALHALYAEAARLMRLNLLTRRRESVPIRRRPQPSSVRLWVYGRAGRPCLDCGTRIERFLQGDMARSTYFCPSCQIRAIVSPGHTSSYRVERKT
jgi:endonuclease-8